MHDEESYEAIVEQLIERIRTVPPRCLSDLKPTFFSYEYEGYHNVRWALACQCGCARGKVLGRWMNFSQNQDPRFNHFGAPHAFVCAACDRTAEFFDKRYHGYDAEIMPDQTNRFVEDPPAGPRQAFQCPKCAANEGAVVAAFSQSHFDAIDDQPDRRPRVQDFFDSMGIRFTCASCQNEANVTGYELA